MTSTGAAATRRVYDPYNSGHVQQVDQQAAYHRDPDNSNSYYYYNNGGGGGGGGYSGGGHYYGYPAASRHQQQPQQQQQHRQQQQQQQHPAQQQQQQQQQAPGYYVPPSHQRSHRGTADRAGDTSLAFPAAPSSRGSTPQHGPAQDPDESGGVPCDATPGNEEDESATDAVQLKLRDAQHQQQQEQEQEPGQKEKPPQFQQPAKALVDEGFISAICTVLSNFVHSSNASAPPLVNGMLPANPGAPPPLPPTVFHALRAPNVTVEKYCNRVVKYTMCQKEDIVVALILIDRLLYNQPLLRLDSLTFHRIFLTAMVVSIKSRQDMFFTNTFYSQVGGVNITEFNALEAFFLLAIDFDTYVDKSMYDIFLKELFAEQPPY